MATENIAKIYAGVVKAPSSVHLKNPSLYIDVLEGKEVLHSAFFKPETGCHKATDAIRVDCVNCEQRKENMNLTVDAYIIVFLRGTKEKKAALAQAVILPSIHILLLYGRYKVPKNHMMIGLSSYSLL